MLLALACAVAVAFAALYARERQRRKLAEGRLEVVYRCNRPVRDRRDEEPVILKFPRRSGWSA